MALIVAYDPSLRISELRADQAFVSTRLNVLGLEYGYKYRLDVRTRDSPVMVEFVRTLREARFVGRPLRRRGYIVHFFKIRPDGDLSRHNW